MDVAPGAGVLRAAEARGRERVIGQHGGIDDNRPMKSRTLSKSRFKLALECPTKVFYSLDRRYVNTKNEDEFLQALADGGFQVGELAKRMYAAEDPTAVEITAREEDEQVRQTTEVLGRPSATVFEGTVKHGDMLVRVDVLRKRGDVVDLIEVKSKSFNRNREDHSFRGKRGGIRSTWLPYLQDVAFQTWVCRQAYPGLEVRPFLLLVDPTQTCSIGGLGTAIRVDRDAAGRAVVTVAPGFDVRALRPPLLTPHDVSEFVEEILAGLVETPEGMFGFAEYAGRMAAVVVAGRKVDPPVGAQCKKCEFYCEPADRTADMRSGWAECMAARFPGRGDVPRAETVFALYDDRKKKGNKLSHRASCCSPSSTRATSGRKRPATKSCYLIGTGCRSGKRGEKTRRPCCGREPCARRSTVGRFRCTSSTSRRHGRRCRSRRAGARISSCCSSSRTT